MAARYLLDSNILIAAIKGEPRSLLNRLARVAPQRLCLSSVVLGEMATGAQKSHDPWQRNQELTQLVRDMETLAFDHNDAVAYGRVRAELEHRGQAIGPLDMLIAAQCVNRGLVLVTANLREFHRVSGLQCENWLS